MHIAILATGGSSGVPYIVAGVIGVPACIAAFAAAGRSESQDIRVTIRVVTIILAIIMVGLIFVGWVVETLSNDPAL